MFFPDPALFVKPSISAQSAKGWERFLSRKAPLEARQIWPQTGAFINLGASATKLASSFLESERLPGALYIHITPLR